MADKVKRRVKPGFVWVDAKGAQHPNATTVTVDLGAGWVRAQLHKLEPAGAEKKPAKPAAKKKTRKR